VSILETYFECEEGDDQNLAPQLAGNQYAFGQAPAQVRAHRCCVNCSQLVVWAAWSVSCERELMSCKAWCPSCNQSPLSAGWQPVRVRAGTSTGESIFVLMLGAV
jgi:hypothetical protein